MKPARSKQDETSPNSQQWLPRSPGEGASHGRPEANSRGLTNFGRVRRPPVHLNCCKGPNAQQRRIPEPTATALDATATQAENLPGVSITPAAPQLPYRAAKFLFKPSSIAAFRSARNRRRYAAKAGPQNLPHRVLCHVFYFTSSNAARRLTLRLFSLRGSIIETEVQLTA